MGLDMYAYRTPADNLVNPHATADLEIKDREQVHKLAYWRKHHDLHGWMHQLYRERDGKGSEFNCDTVRLTAEDLDALEADIKARKLPPTTGFFFGNNPPNSDSNVGDLKFISDAREALKNGDIVYYDSWW